MESNAGYMDVGYVILCTFLYNIYYDKIDFLIYLKNKGLEGR